MTPLANSTLSLVIPAYNEGTRLPPYLNGVREYLQAEFPDRYEVIVVDDGSRDELPSRLAQMSREWPELSVLTHAKNLGKGAALRTGMLAARGDLFLFTDADGAAPIEEEHALRAAIAGGAQVAVGSRLIGPTCRGKPARKWYRGLLGRCFAGVIRRLLRLPVRDSQCGFKLFSRDAGRLAFCRSSESGYLIDIEILIILQQMDFCIAEVPITWQDVPGSKVRPMRDGWKMLRGAWDLRRRARWPCARKGPRVVQETWPPLHHPVDNGWPIRPTPGVAATDVIPFPTAAAAALPAPGCTRPAPTWKPGDCGR